MQEAILLHAIPGTKDCFASTEGDIYHRDITNGSFIKKHVRTPDDGGLSWTKVNTGRKSASRRAVARLVCLAFNGEPPTPTSVACQRDSDVTNVHADNLFWADGELLAAHTSAIAQKKNSESQSGDYNGDD